MLIPAGEKLSGELENVELREGNMPVLSNAENKYYTLDDTKDFLVQQVSKSVLWVDNVEKMINDGVDTFVEIGPGKSLSGFIKKIAKKLGTKVNTYNVSDMKTLNDTIDVLKG